MAKSNSEQTDGSAVVEKGLGVLDRAWNAQWALRLTCLALFLDIAMMIHTGHGLSQWSDGDKELLGDVGLIVLTLVAFSFAVAIVMPVILNLFRHACYFVLACIPTSRKSPDDRRYQRPLGRVPVRAFHDLALRERSEFLLDLYQSHEQERIAASQFRERTGELTAAVLLVASIDYLISWLTPNCISVVDTIIEASGDWASIIVLVVLLSAGAIVKWAWFTDTPPNEIYYPPLDRELRENEARIKGLS
ncbi:hypothetical protein [[Pseudomonas] boreopolis]|uniref:hypothetical protein n=1 Tax=Xanthomonas boreopolis TaxID=86183 RepID=UPI003D4B11E6